MTGPTLVAQALPEAEHRRETDPLIAACWSVEEAEASLGALAAAGTDLRRISVVGKGCQIRHHGATACACAAWGLIANSTVYALPGAGLVAAAGPIAPLMTQALDARCGACDAFEQALQTLGLDAARAAAHARALRTGRILLIHHGSDREIARAMETLAVAPPCALTATTTPRPSP